MGESLPIIVAGAAVFVALAVFSAAAEEGQENRCAKTKSEYMAAEQAWSETNAEVSFMRQELERLRAIRWEMKTTLSVMHDGAAILKDASALSNAQRMALNARIPPGRGTLNPDGSFTMTNLDLAPLDIEEATDILTRVVKDTDEEIQSTEEDLRREEEMSHDLLQKVASLEQEIENECRAAGKPTLWEQGVPRVSSQELYDRYVDRERMREQAVAERRYADIERLWAKRYYPYSRYRSGTHRGNARGLLIELRDVGGTKKCRQCYPFWVPWEKQVILDELERASRENEKFPRVGRLGSYRVLGIYPEIYDCYRRSCEY